MCLLSAIVFLCLLQPQLATRNLSFIFNSHFNFSDQVSDISHACLYNIRDLRRIRSVTNFDSSPYWHIIIVVAVFDITPPNHQFVHNNNDVCTGHWSIMPANVSGWTATRILMDTATSLRLTAARTTSTASVIATTRRHTPTPRASTWAEFILTEFVIIMVTITRLWKSDCYNRSHYVAGSYISGVDEMH